MLPSRWAHHIVQSFVHGANVAVAHLLHEAALTVRHAPQAGRPYCVTDPNPPIRYRDLYMTIKTLSIHVFLDVPVEPVFMLLLSYLVEWYSLLPYRLPFVGKYMPEMTGDLRYLKPGLFSICTHLVSCNTEASKPLGEGGLGYRGVLTTLDGMTMEVLEWNKEHTLENGSLKRKAYTTSVLAADKIRQLGIDGWSKAP
ncbi:hypothetical protein PFICI_14434 [Pestalotiopsis fici W106-1]|uniref:Uncharacterized protein n=1 Tax=Pestalotiopsis fici (strain W106-1 / CGMCC3.15140) TaxID=1229662 RepID=W3WHW4_PESFW|nr:uncharacterized protein PFICI_14434 [Pestalotiopsis fici W106-1]ETS73488.1 hypothetical protein PFICI_14434 [Pestalotiopsis fici W106-1]